MGNSLRPKPRWVVAIYLLLLALIIPWYWPAENDRQIFGFPVWVILSLGGLFLTSCFTAWVCLRVEEPKE